MPAKLALWLCVTIGLVGCAAHPRTVTVKTLLNETVDLSNLGNWPTPAFTCRQFSSYDRASVSPDNAETWMANGDVNQYLRVDDHAGRKEYVMMDADGPGVIVRIWSANPAGTLRIYLDRADAPVVEMRMDDFLSGRGAGFPAALAGEHSRGWNNYFPIPYAQHCKVTSDQPGFYYHVDYRTYGKDAVVETLTPGAIAASADQAYTLAGDLAFNRRRIASGRLSAPLVTGGVPAEFQERWRVVNIAAGAKASLCELDGAKAITGFAVRLAASDRTQALRHAVLRGEFDGEQTIESPLGDFFGSAPGVTPYVSLPMGMAESGVLWSRWAMPFRRSGKLEIENLGSEPVSLSYAVLSEARAWNAGSMHFHANWKVEHEFPTRPMCDWNYLTVKGQGVFVGAAFAIANPVKPWWGEGDEKIYVDGEKFPSFFGTGTEDYFGYAWCWPAPFNHAYHNQTRCDGPGNYGHTAVNRWHIMDRIPFTRDFRFDMEIWHWHPDAKLDFSVVTYWFGKPGARATVPPITRESLRLKLLPPYVPAKVQGAIEGEGLTVLEKTGKVEVQEMDNASDEKHLWWQGAKVGDKLVLKLPATPAGKYRMFVRCVKAPDYGIQRFALNGTPLGSPIDFYYDRVALGDEFDLGAVDVADGENRLSVEVAGTNPKAKPGQMCGIDYVRLDRIP